MKISTTLNLALASCILGLVTGCASTKVTSQERLVYEHLPRPQQIYVFDFASSPVGAPADSSFVSHGNAPTVYGTPEQLELGRQLGASMAEDLVADIREMGLPAMRVLGPLTPQVNDIVIRGYLISIEEGSAAKRMTIGFGSGASELAVGVEAYQMTQTGLRKLGSATTAAKGSKTPGAGLGAAGWAITGSPVGLIVGGGMKIYGEASGSSKVEGRAKASAKEIADQLKLRFQQQGWIN